MNDLYKFNNITLESNTVPVQFAKFVMEDLKSVPYLVPYRVNLKLISSVPLMPGMIVPRISLILAYHFLASFFLACTPTLSVKTAVKKKNI